MMKVVKNSTVLNRLIKDTSGAFSLMWAVAMTGILVTIGASYDLAQISKAKSIAQYAADNMALAASIAVDFENSDRYVAGRAYPYASIGAGKADFTGTMKGSVQYDVDDTAANNLPVGDKARLLARATVTGTYSPAFISMVPGMSNIAFTATSDVSYAASEGSPASIFFVVDNSGSMGRRDSSRRRRIDSLKTSMKSFMQSLQKIETGGESVFRTGLFPYNSNIINNRVVNPKWNTLTDYNINVMRAGGGTNSTPALTRAKQKYTSENTIHKNKHGNDKPLKFLVFMTDGVNATGGQYGKVCKIKRVWLPGKRAHYKLYWGSRTYTYYRWYGWMKRYNVRYFPKTKGGYENKEVCNYEQLPGTSNNDLSLKQCTAMKNDDVKIYSIAYGVGRGSTADTFMKNCSSGIGEYYKYAENGADLQTVFDQIGASIVKEVIRIKR